MHYSSELDGSYEEAILSLEAHVTQVTRALVDFLESARLAPTLADVNVAAALALESITNRR